MWPCKMHGHLTGVRFPTALSTSLHSSILLLGKDSVSAVGHSCPASSFVEKIQPLGILKQISCFPSSPWLHVWGLDYQIGNS